MAIVNNYNEDDNKDESKAPKSSNFAGEQSTINPPQGAAPKGTSSGRFTNIQNYINANKQGAQNLGSNVAGNISNIGNEAKTGLQQSQNQFDTQANQGRLVRGVSDVQANNVINNAGQSIYNGGTNANQDAIKNFQRISGGQYLGPQALENTETLRSQAQNAKNLGELAGTEGGRYQLLRQMYGNPQYSAGQTALDQLLLGNQTGQLKGARQLVSNLPQNVDQAAQQSANRANAYQLESNQIGKDVTANLNKQLTASDNDLSNTLANTTQKENDLQAAYNRTLQDLANNEVTKSDFDRLKIGNYFNEGNQDAGGSLTRFDVNLPDYIKTNAAQNVTKEGVANYKQAADLNALQQLAAKDPSLNFANVGNYKASSQSVDDAALNPLIEARKNERDAAQKYIKDFDEFKQNKPGQTGNQISSMQYDLDTLFPNQTQHATIDQVRNALPNMTPEQQARANVVLKSYDAAQNFAAKYGLDPGYVYGQLGEESRGSSQIGRDVYLPKVGRFNKLNEQLRIK